MSGINKIYKGLADLIPRDQLAFIYNKIFNFSLEKGNPNHLTKLSKLN